MPRLAELLEGVCSNVDGSRPWHRHVHLMGGLAHGAREYPPKLVTAVLRALRDQLLEDGDLDALQALTAGPVPEEREIPPGEWWSYWDDVKGGYLQKELVEKARAEERQWTKKQGIYEIVPRSQCFEETGKPPIPLKWVDTNKGDSERPKYRSRIVAREIKARKSEDEKIPIEQLFSAMPPLEAVKSLISLFTSWGVKGRAGVSAKPYKLATFDISRAHFYGRARRRVFVELVDEDREEYGQDKCGLLLKSMYGTQDASQIWQDDYAELLQQHGYIRGKSQPAVFYNRETDTRVLVHGDDFMVLGPQEAVDAFEKILASRYEYKKTANLGFGEGDEKETVFLNRVIVVRGGSLRSGRDRSVTLEPDARHVQMLVKELGLEKAKGVETPSEKRSVDQQLLDSKSPLLKGEQVALYRSLTMRAAYLAQDRPDLAEATKSLARHMKEPNEASFRMLVRLGKYLVKYPTVAAVFTEQKEPTKLRVFVDTDHAGCAITRKSTTGMIVFL